VQKLAPWSEYPRPENNFDLLPFYVKKQLELQILTKWVAKHAAHFIAGRKVHNKFHTRQTESRPPVSKRSIVG